MWMVVIGIAATYLMGLNAYGAGRAKVQGAYRGEPIELFLQHLCVWSLLVVGALGWLYYEGWAWLVPIWIASIATWLSHLNAKGMFDGVRRIQERRWKEVRQVWNTLIRQD